MKNANELLLDELRKAQNELYWYRAYGDYVEYHYRNVNNQAIDYANKLQE